ncbi:MAG: imidazolonepropionase [Deltaproteobacteria bacterium]|jgi:imidazolonepropionase|nr:imidazolonepropionase [Deltaproteobacteria bacterium]MBT6433529.1 imidazolonepropionase [Deltaproteobacteria bacterium]MBT6489484.1 imidazolonepropionase [Deltaproteobacteria bacterium]
MGTIHYQGISELVRPFLDEGDTRSPIEVVKQATLSVSDGVVVFAGPQDSATINDGDTTIDLEGRAVLPGLIDSHTHIVFAGDRMDEMARRTRGETYEEIAKAGGGIVRSVEALRATELSSIVTQSQKRLQNMLARGTTTLEIKTGYGLEPELENLQLQVIQKLRQTVPDQTIFATALAHVIPPNRRDNRKEYIDEFCSQVLGPAAASQTVQFCDVFVEATAYTPDECRYIAERAKAAGLKIKLHVDQLHEGGGAALAAELGALSADHLELTSAQGREALAQAGTIATILPGCGLFLGGANWPNGRALRDAGCEVAIATDCNPGSSMVIDLPLCATMGATQCGLSLEESLWGMTRGGAKALGLNDRGSLSPGERADFIVLDHADWRSLLYNPAAAPLHSVFIQGNEL